MPSIRKSLALLGATTAMAAPVKRENLTFKERSLRLYDAVTGSGSYSSPYFSGDRVPYHSVETLMVEAPDHGHESVSETYSFWIWLEAVHGKVTGDYSAVNEAWDYLEKHLIPDAKNQPGNSKYNPSSPATYAAEYDDIDGYPSKLIFQDGLVGQDPIGKELKNAYSEDIVYAMHWIIDGDNWYGYGQQGDGTSTPSFINTFQRGASESTWKTVPHPSWEAMKWGGRNGFLDLFTVDNGYSKQWRYTAAPDADARAIQGAYFAYKWAEEDGKLSQIGNLNERAARLGDFLRYAHYDKYFKKIGNCVGYQKCAAGTGKNSAHYLISWYFAWGGGLQGDWAWRIGSSHTHTGYQSPLAAWILSTQKAFKPKGSTAVADWSKSLERQVELFRWLQSSEGCIAGGATNSWKGAYEQPGSEITSFYGMWYDWQPVYHDPPSNNWTGMQGWGMERLCAMYYLSGDERAGKVCTRWVEWVKETTRINGNEVVHATNLAWSGNPDEWDPDNFDNDNMNASLHGTVSSDGIDLGTIASIMKAVMWTCMKNGDKEGIKLAVDVIDKLETYWDGELGYASEEAREDYSKFGQEVYIPSGWTGKNAQGANIKSGMTFIDMRPKYKEDPDWGQVEDFLNGGSAPVFHYHRFWAQAEIAVAQGIISIFNLDEDGGDDDERTTCPAAITNQGYQCCKKGCTVEYTDGDGEWGIENNEWCGCGSTQQAVTCPAAITSQGYPCCEGCDVQYTDSDGKWGVENNDWCGIPTSC